MGFPFLYNLFLQDRKSLVFDRVISKDTDICLIHTIGVNHADKFGLSINVEFCLQTCKNVREALGNDKNANNVSGTATEFRHLRFII